MLSCYTMHFGQCMTAYTKMSWLRVHLLSCAFYYQLRVNKNYESLKQIYVNRNYDSFYHSAKEATLIDDNSFNLIAHANLNCVKDHSYDHPKTDIRDRTAHSGPRSGQTSGLLLWLSTQNVVCGYSQHSNKLMKWAQHTAHVQNCYDFRCSLYGGRSSTQIDHGALVSVDRSVECTYDTLSHWSVVAATRDDREGKLDSEVQYFVGQFGQGAAAYLSSSGLSVGNVRGGETHTIITLNLHSYQNGTRLE